jgi:SOS-response transcriptional repressor LexA|tara:strand:- start:466 stop:675 length:210 start_codon:yes stop_codon:yes gene_type:complete
MTQKQKKLFDFIKKYISNNGLSPSYKEMQVHMNLSLKSKSIIHNYLVQLEKLNVISRIPAKWRGVRLVD